MSISSANGSSAERSYFDLHITGLGYLNRIRSIPPKKGKGDSYLACTIAALHGPSDSVDYCYIDAKVIGKDAIHLIHRCTEAVDAKRKVLMGFRVGDPWIDQFTYSKGPKAGQPGASLKARLLFVSWIKIDGEFVYKAEAKAAEETKGEESASAETADGKVPAEAPADEASAEAPLLPASSF